MVITSGTKYARHMLPFILVWLWLLQRFYLRFSRQLRKIDAEAKSPLFAKLSDIASGLEHIRAFGWQQAVLDKSLALIDTSQKPYYYSWCLQRWLMLTLDLKVSIIAMGLVAIGVHLEDATTTASLGVALLCTMSYSLSTKNLVRDWARADNCVQTVVRLKSFVEETPTEQDSPDAELVYEGNGRRGAVEFHNVGAAYR